MLYNILPAFADDFQFFTDRIYNQILALKCTGCHSPDGFANHTVMGTRWLLARAFQYRPGSLICVTNQECSRKFQCPRPAIPKF